MVVIWICIALICNSSVESQKGVNAIQWCFVENQKGIIAAQQKVYSLNAVEWKSTLFGVILGITSFGVESTPKLLWNPLQSSGLNHSFEGGFYYFERGFPLQKKGSLIWLLKEWISTPAHLESMTTAPFWFSTEHHWTALTPFWLSANGIKFSVTPSSYIKGTG